MGAFQARKLFETEIKVPDKCPICGGDVIKSTGRTYSGCHLCAPQLEVPSDSFATSLLDIGASITHSQTRPQKISRPRKRRARLTAQPLIKQVTVMHEKRTETIRPFFAAFIASGCGAVLGLILCLINLTSLVPPFMLSETYQPKNLKIANVNYSQQTGYLTFDTLNDGALPVEDFKLAVGMFDVHGDFVGLTTVNGKSIALGSRSTRSVLATEALLQPREKKSFKIKLERQAEKVSIVPVYAKFVM